MLAQIGGALDSTGDLLTGLLDMSRLEAGGLVPQPRDFPLAEVLEPLASEFGAIAAARGLRFRFAATSAWVHSDPQLLRRVLQNFLANAVRYTARGGVLLGARRDGDSVRIEVHDTGPGIEPALQLAMFDEFRRGDDAPGQGLGLGLSIADRIAQLLHAPLSVRSEPGRGACFAVTVTTVQAPPMPAAAAATRGVAGLRVLVVDNDPDALAALSRVLAGWGCEVAAAEGRAGAEARLAEAPATLWLFDYHLDDGDTGIALAADLAARHGAQPTLILSADGGHAVRHAVLEAGHALLAKPLKPLALKSVLDRLLAGRGVQPAPAVTGT